jgi:putative SOS response-associated peptidase YedK
MCGRFVIAKELSGITELFELDEVPENYSPVSFNIAPTQRVPIIVELAVTTLFSRQLHPARWGLIPSWAKEVSATLFNARIETALEKPSFRESIQKKRCAIPASGYFEWQATDSGKQPFFIHPPDGMLALAGIYSWWRDPAKAAADSARWILSCSILTKDSAPALSQIHDRNPVFLSKGNLTAWLAPDYPTTPELLSVLSKESDLVAKELSYYPVSSKVGQVSANSPDLIEPL